MGGHAHHDTELAVALLALPHRHEVRQVHALGDPARLLAVLEALFKAAW